MRRTPSVVAPPASLRYAHHSQFLAALAFHGTEQFPQVLKSPPTRLQTPEQTRDAPMHPANAFGHRATPPPHLSTYQPSTPSLLPFLNLQLQATRQCRQRRRLYRFCESGKHSYENIVRNLPETRITSIFLTLSIGTMSHPPIPSPASSDLKGAPELVCLGELPGRHILRSLSRVM